MLFEEWEFVLILKRIVMIQVYFSTHKIQKQFFQQRFWHPNNNIQRNTITTRAQQSQICFPKSLFLCGFLCYIQKKKLNCKKRKHKNSFTSHSFFVIGVIVCHILSPEKRSRFQRRINFSSSL